jgi:bile acid-coenzyme A ligase
VELVVAHAMTTFAEQIEAHAIERASEPAVTCGAETITWHELVDGSARMAGHFQEMGARPGSMVMIALPNSCALVQAAVAAWWIGATPAPISVKLPLAERQAIISLASPSVIVGGDTGSAIEWNGVAGDPARHERGYPSPEPFASKAWKAIASGGSTGRPKLIVAEQAAEVELISPFADLLRAPAGATLLVPGPLSHNAPFVATSLGLLRGNHVVLMPRFDASECLRLAEQHAACWLYQVPTMMLRIWRLPEAERLDRNLRSLETVFHMASPCPPWLKRGWIDWLGPDRIVELYAGTELQAMTIVSGGEWLTHQGTVGRVALGEMEVRDQDGRPLPPGETGEVWMRRGADVPAPYRYIGARPRAAAANWESLGDNGHFDSDGYLYLADRAADMIVVGGSNVYPAEIEAALEEHPSVRSSCVIGLPHEDLGSAPHALVELAEKVTDDELTAWLRERVAPYKVPRSFERADEPLRDDAGKVRRSQLRAVRVAPASARLA